MSPPDRLLNGLTEELAWPTLRAHLQLLAAAGADPVAALFTAAPRDLMSAHDQAAVIDSRIHDINVVTAGGPLPGIPDPIAVDPEWGPYLEARSHLVSAPTRLRPPAAEAKPTRLPPRRRQPGSDSTFTRIHRALGPDPLYRAAVLEIAHLFGLDRRRGPDVGPAR